MKSFVFPYPRFVDALFWFGGRLFVELVTRGFVGRVEGFVFRYGRCCVVFVLLFRFVEAVFVEFVDCVRDVELFLFIFSTWSKSESHPDTHPT